MPAGACNHALGRLALAYADYDSAFGTTVGSSAAQETLNFRATAYYQGEICVYLQKKLDADVLHFSIDRDLDEEFKELWAKQQMPTQKLLHRRPKQLKKGQKFPPDRRDVPAPPEADVQVLADFADGIGHLLQYTHQGAALPGFGFLDFGLLFVHALRCGQQRCGEHKPRICCCRFHEQPAAAARCRPGSR